MTDTMTFDDLGAAVRHFAHMVSVNPDTALVFAAGFVAGARSQTNFGDSTTGTFRDAMIRNLYHNGGISQTDIATNLNIPQSTISRTCAKTGNTNANS